MAAKKKQGSGLAKKVGPLPLWGWLVAGFFVYEIVVKPSSSAAGAVLPSGGEAASAVQPLPYYGFGGYGSSAAPSGGASGPLPLSTGNPSPITPSGMAVDPTYPPPPQPMSASPIPVTTTTTSSTPGIQPGGMEIPASSVFTPPPGAVHETGGYGAGGGYVTPGMATGPMPSSSSSVWSSSTPISPVVALHARPAGSSSSSATSLARQTAAKQAETRSLAKAVSTGSGSSVAQAEAALSQMGR